MRPAQRTRRLSRTESKDLTRRRLLDAARAVFLRHGFHATTVDMVAEEAGFTKGAVYSAFASKADLFLALYEERTERRAAQAASIATVAGARVEEATSDAWAEVLRRERPWLLVLLEFWIFAARDDALRARFASIHARYRAHVARAIAADAAASGRTLPLAPELLALCHMALGNGFALETFRDPALKAGDIYARAARALARGLETLRADAPESRTGAMR
jgi:AcrR family transcriptional regulator